MGRDLTKFLWDRKNSRKKVHLMRWSDVTKPLLVGVWVWSFGLSLLNGGGDLKS